MEILLAIAQESYAMNFPDQGMSVSSPSSKCWDGYQRLLKNLDAVQATGEEESLTALQLLIEVSGQIQDYAREFEMSGVTIGEMQSSLDQIESLALVLHNSAEEKEKDMQEQTQNEREEELYRTLKENQEAAQAKLEFMKEGK